MTYRIKHPPLFALFFAPSRKRRGQRRGDGLIGLAVAVGIVFAVFRLADIPIADILSLAVVAVAIVGGGFVVFGLARLSARSTVAYRTNSAIKSKAGQCVAQHVEVLARKKAQLVIRDDYGVLQTAAWEKAKAAFIRNQIEPMLSPSESSFFGRSRAAVSVMIDDRVALVASANAATTTFSDEFSGEEFEAFCADELRRSGWDDVRVTQKTGDQGVDVIAMKSGVRLVLQCKKYGRPIGNKAIQEIAAGRMHEKANIAAVVSNQSYTVAARRLAATTNVFLLHYADLTKSVSQWPKVGHFKNPTV